MSKIRSHAIGSLALALVLGAVPNLTGCDKTKSEHDVQVTHPDGSTETDKTKTVQTPTGATETKTEKTTSGPSTP